MEFEPVLVAEIEDERGQRAPEFEDPNKEEYSERLSHEEELVLENSKNFFTD